MLEFTDDVFGSPTQQLAPYQEQQLSTAPASPKSEQKFAEIPATAVSGKYKRLQVERIWLRALFEMVCIITALILCCTIIVSSYEKSYSGYTRIHTADNTLQLAHFISSLTEVDAAESEDAARQEYLREQLCSRLDSCFISEDMIYSGAVYRVSGEDIELFASGSEYLPALQEGGIIDDEGVPVKEYADILSTAALGSEQSTSLDNIYLALVPHTDENGLVHSISVASTTYRTSLDYPSIVRGRLVWISIVCSLLIIIYYSISAARSEKKRQNATGKDVVS